MEVVLGHNQYGKAENRVVRVFRDRDPHHIVDYNVSVALSGGQEAPHLTGDNGPVPPTDTQKNTVYAFAADDRAAAQPVSFGMRLARHFVDEVEPITWARIKLEMYPWTRLGHPMPSCATAVRPHRHRHLRRLGPVGGVRSQGPGTAEAHRLGVLRLPARPLHHPPSPPPTGSWPPRWSPSGGTPASRSTGPPPTTASWPPSRTPCRPTQPGPPAHLYEMGAAVLAVQPQVAEVRFAAPNRHHFAYDLARFGLDGDFAGSFSGTLRVRHRPDTH